MSGLKFALTQPYQCNYLDDEKEQLLVCMPPEGVMHKKYYEWLITEGFRRSGDQVYRPHCGNCNACTSVRVLTHQFKPTRSQKRVLSKAKDWTFGFVTSLTDEHYRLYESYISARHADGTMYPPSKPQFIQFVQCNWHPAQYLEARHKGQLVALAVTDIFEQAFSALYTFFDPELAQYSPGTLMILQQIEHAKQHGKRYLYLGYQVDGCQKMAYKDKYLPQEQFINGKWSQITKKAE